VRGMVCTSVAVDWQLIAEALELTGLKTKKAVIEEALHTLTRLKRQERVRALRGQLHWEGNLDEQRAGRFSEVHPCR